MVTQAWVWLRRHGCGYAGMGVVTQTWVWLRRHGCWSQPCVGDMLTTFVPGLRIQPCCLSGKESSPPSWPLPPRRGAWPSSPWSPSSQAPCSPSPSPRVGPGHPRPDPPPLPSLPPRGLSTSSNCPGAMVRGRRMWGERGGGGGEGRRRRMWGGASP